MTSSAGAKRTSIGNATPISGRPASASTRRTASAACSRPIAYSISVKLIRRSLANTLKLRSTLVVAPDAPGREP